MADEFDGVPEPIQLAERWRQAGKIVATRSPQLFEEFSALMLTWLAAMQDAETKEIDFLYRNA